MSWTNPRTWADGDIPTGAMLNEQIRDNFLYLYGAMPSIARLTYSENAGVNGTSYTSGAWRTVTVNSEDLDDDGIVTLASNQFELSAGTYILSANVSVQNTASAAQKFRFYNTSDSVSFGQTQHLTASSDRPTVALSDVVVLGAPKTIELQIYSSATVEHQSLNVAGEREWYVQVSIVKVG